MEIKIVSETYKKDFDKLASHPLQSWAWGEFREKSGVEVIRLGKFDGNELIETITITFHSIPHTSFKVGYIPKSYWPSDELLNGIYAEAKERNCIFVKLEPNIPSRHPREGGDPLLKKNIKFTIFLSPHPLFTKFTQEIDLTKSEEEMLKSMHTKTRYNIRVAEKHGVVIKERTDDSAFDDYLTLMFQTTKRQGFFAHTQKYHQKMWETLKGNMAHLFTAEYNVDGHSHTLVTWILFLFNDVLYYPYGASSDKFRNVMASNLMMWEAIKFGKKHQAKRFDMWGSLGPNANPKDPWYGFHKFKQGYGAQLIEFAGSYDLVIQPNLYKFYNHAHALRQVFLKIKRSFTS